MDGAAQKQETRVGNLWRVENKGGTGGFFFYLYICSKQWRSEQGWDGWVHAVSDLMIRTMITTRTMWKRKFQQLDKS